MKIYYFNMLFVNTEEKVLENARSIFKQFFKLKLKEAGKRSTLRNSLQTQSGEAKYEKIKQKK